MRADTVHTTFPRLMLAHARQRPHDPALREKALGIWQTLSWEQLATLVQQLAGGLAEGVRDGETRYRRP